jgi:hypothetical protein
VKAMEARLKEKDAEMAEERRALEREVVRAAQHAQARNADTAAKFRCASVTHAAWGRRSRLFRVPSQAVHNAMQHTGVNAGGCWSWRGR